MSDQSKTIEDRLLFVARELKVLGDMESQNLLTINQDSIYNDIWNDNLDRAIAHASGDWDPTPAHDEWGDEPFARNF